MQEDVGVDPAPEAVAEGEHPAHLRRGDAVDRPAQPGVEGHLPHRLQQQRIEVEHAELAVAHPGLALAKPLVGADVHEHRPRPLELHVVRGGVLEDQVVLERGQQQVELHERGVLEHREGPLVGVGDEGDPLVAQHAGGLVHQEALDGAEPVGSALGRHQALVLEQAGGLERLEVGQPVGREGPQHLVARVEDPALGIAEGAGLEAGVRGRGAVRLGSGHAVGRRRPAPEARPAARRSRCCSGRRRPWRPPAHPCGCAGTS